MKAKLLNDRGGRTYALVFDTDDEVVSQLTRFAEENRLHAASFTAIGAFSEATLGYFDWEKKDYLRTRIAEQVEVLALVGDIALAQGKPKVHAHVDLERGPHARGRADRIACPPRARARPRERPRAHPHREVNVLARVAPTGTQMA